MKPNINASQKDVNSKDYFHCKVGACKYRHSLAYTMDVLWIYLHRNSFS